MNYKVPRQRNLYTPGVEKPFEISRSKIDAFIKCRRCFYLDRRLGISQPPFPPYTLNNGVDRLLKSEFDIYREKGEKHPIMEEYNVDAIPIDHPELDHWRFNFKGVRYFNEDLNIIFFGAIDDLWLNSSGEYVIVDYKSTSKKDDIIELDQPWHNGYKRQMDIYQWLLSKNGYSVSDTGYFLYCNADTYKERFDAFMGFRLTLHSYHGNRFWVEDTIIELYECLNLNDIPEASPECYYCEYSGATISALSVN